MPQRLAQHLLSKGLLPAATVDEALRRMGSLGGTLDTALLEMRVISEAGVLQAISDVAEVRLVNLADFEPNIEAVSLIPEKMARQLNMVPLSLDGKSLHVACAYPLSAASLKDVGFLLGKQLEIWVALECRIRDWFSSLYKIPLEPRYAKLLQVLDPNRPVSPETLTSPKSRSSGVTPVSSSPSSSTAATTQEPVLLTQSKNKTTKLSAVPQKRALGDEEEPRTAVIDPGVYARYIKSSEGPKADPVTNAPRPSAPMLQHDDSISPDTGERTSVVDTNAYAALAKEISKPAGSEDVPSPRISFPGGVLPPRATNVPPPPPIPSRRDEPMTWVHPATPMRASSPRPEASPRARSSAPTAETEVPELASPQSAPSGVRKVPPSSPSRAPASGSSPSGVRRASPSGVRPRAESQSGLERATAAAAPPSRESSSNLQEALTPAASPADAAARAPYRSSGSSGVRRIPSSAGAPAASPMTMASASADSPIGASLTGADAPSLSYGQAPPPPEPPRPPPPPPAPAAHASKAVDHETDFSDVAPSEEGALPQPHASPAEPLPSQPAQYGSAAPATPYASSDTLVEGVYVEPPPPPPPSALPPPAHGRTEWTLADARAALKLATQHRNDLLAVILEFGARTFEYTGVFAVMRGAAYGWDSRGDEDPTAFRSMAIPLDASSVFRTVSLTRGSYIGPLPPDSLSQHYLGTFGRTPRAVFLWPVEVHSKLIAIVYGDCGSRPISQRKLADFILFCRDLPASFQELILFRKQNPAAQVAPPPDYPAPAEERAPDPSAPTSGGDTDWFAGLLQLLTGPNATERYDAMLELMKTPLASARALVQAFPGPTGWSRLPVVELPEADELGPIPGAIARLGASAGGALAPLLDSPDSDTRYLALLTAGSIQSPDVLDGVLRGMFDLEPDISSAARVAGTRLRAVPGFWEKLAFLRQELASTDALRRSLAARALGALHDRDAIEGLIHLAGSDDDLCAQSAAEALKEITRASFGTNPRAWTAWWAGSRVKRRIEWLVDALASEEFDMRLCAIEELSRFTGDNLGFFADGPAPERSAARAQWLAYIVERTDLEIA